MICKNPCRRISIQLLATDSRSMSIDHLSGPLGYKQFLKDTIVCPNDSRKIHKFSKPQDPLSLNWLLHLCCTDHSACMLKWRRRNTGRNHILNIQCSPLRCLHHIIQPSDPTDVYNLMWVRNDCCRSMRY